MSHIATGDIRQNLKEIEEAISKAATLAASKSDHTSKAIAGVLLVLQATINGGGLVDWIVFCQEFGKKMHPIWAEELDRKNN